jgi:hypothetical protein
MSRILIGLAAVWLFAGGFGPAASSACGNNLSPQRSCKPCKRPDGTLNHAPNVTDFALDKIQLKFKPLPEGVSPDDVGPSTDMMINVATSAEDAENDVLDYHYTISGGRIVGSGSNVQWDLNGVLPGTYTITAGVDDSCGICGKTITKAVMIIGKAPAVAAAPVKPVATKPAAPTTTAAAPTAAKAPASAATDRPRMTVTARTPASTAAATAPATGTAVAPCSCPKIIVSDPERSDSDLIFTTKIFDLATANRLTYIWTITGGSVVSQDGRSIRVKPGVLGGSVSVTVNGLDPKCSCPNRAQKTF